MSKEFFFMVYVQDEKTPTYKHTTMESAEIEAKILSRLLKKKAYILSSIKAFELNEFTVHDCRPDLDDLPF